MKKYTKFSDFYNYYLTEHQNIICRRLHVVGTTLVIILFCIALSFKSWSLLILVPFCGYGFAWVGHAFFEKNKPATFKYPLWSLISDFKLFFDILFGKRSFNSSKD